MSLVVESVTQTLVGANDSTPTFNMPATRPDGDLYLAFVMSDGLQGVSLSFSGWNRVLGGQEGSVCVATFWRIGSSEPASYTGAGNSEQFVIFVVRVSGADATTPVAVDFDSTGNSATAVAPGGSNGVPADGLVFRAWAIDTDAPTYTSGPTGHTFRGGAASVAGGGAGAVYGGLATKDALTSSGVDIGTATMPGTYSDNWATHSVVIAPGATGTQYQQAVSTSSTATPSMARRAGVVRSSSSTATASVVRAMAVVRAAAPSTTASVVKQARKSIVVSATGVASLAASRLFLALLSVTVTGSASLLTALSYQRVLSVSATGTAAITRGARKAVTAASTTAALMGRAVSVARSATATATAVLTKRAGLTFSTALASAALVVRATDKALTTTSTAAPSMVRNAALTLSSGSTGTAQVARQVGKTLSASANALASLATEVTQAGAQTYYLTIAAAATASASVTKGVRKGLSASVSGVAALVLRGRGIAVATVTRLYRALVSTSSTGSAQASVTRLATASVSTAVLYRAQVNHARRWTAEVSYG